MTTTTTSDQTKIWQSEHKCHDPRSDTTFANCYSVWPTSNNNLSRSPYHLQHTAVRRPLSRLSMKKMEWINRFPNERSVSGTIHSISQQTTDTSCYVYSERPKIQWSCRWEINALENEVEKLSAVSVFVCENEKKMIEWAAKQTVNTDWLIAAIIVRYATMCVCALYDVSNDCKRMYGCEWRWLN